MDSFIHKIGIILLFSAPIADESLNTELVAHFPYEEGVNDSWGYTSTDGREFAIVGTNSGTSIVEVTQDSIFEVGFISGGESIWRDMKSWGNYIYSGTENNSGGIQVISMENPDSPELVYTWDGALSSHNIMIEDGYLYVIGASEVAYIIILSLEDPTHPEQVGIWNEEYLHDICFDGDILYGCGIYSGTMFAIDVSDKHNPQTINYWTGVPSAHACWPTEDGNYILTASETGTGHIMIWDVEDLYNVNLASEWVPEGAEWESAHNVFVRDNYAYMSYYKFGLQIIDISNPYEPEIAGYYDTYPEDEGGLFNGAWGTYPFQPSCNIYISDRQTGLYVVNFDGCIGADPLDPMPPSEVIGFSDYLTPESISISWVNPELLHDGSSLTSFSVSISRNETFIAEIVDESNEYIDDGLVDGSYYTYQISTIDLLTDSTSNIVIFSAYSGGSPFPSEPEDFTAIYINDEIELTWTNPITQSDGTYLDDLSYSRIYRNGSIISELSSISGELSSYLDSPPTGYIYNYYITSVDNEMPPNESNPTELVEVFAGEFPEYLIWEPSENTPLSGLLIFNDMESLGQLGYLTNDLWIFGNPVDQNFKAIFILNGIWPNNHQLTLTEQNIIQEYILTGGNVYLEDGEFWSQENENNLIRYFQCIGLSDGLGDLGTIEGIPGVFTENLNFDYTGENNWIDRLQSLPGAFPILVNADPEYVTAVANDNESYRTIGTSFEYGGLPNSDQRVELLNGIINFFDNGGAPNWVLGDINQDESIDILDIIMVVDFILENHTPSPVEYWTSDLNQDGILDILDIMLIVQTILE